MVHLFGIRHHGPGCARSLAQALQALQPDCVLIEGPPEADGILPLALDPTMQPPVALLVHCPDEPALSVFYPLADFSPEWQAMRYALGAGVPVRFMDLPQAHSLALRQQQEASAQQEQQADAEAPSQESEAPVQDEDSPQRADPLDWLAQAAGYSDGESWWNHMVEERGDGKDLFEAIAEAMRELRSHIPPDEGARGHREALREAHMRSCIREARKQDYQRIAVICGAWHVPALASDGPGAPTAKADAQLLKSLPKVKVAATWVPWTYRHLTMASGYGAGVASPGWYDFLWRHEGNASRSVSWLARVARLLREEDIDCSSAHVIEGIRLADTLAALRERPAPGMAELDEACITVLCHGESTPMRLIQERLVVGERLGQVPEGVPAVPLQRDIEAQQKSLRLKPEALARNLELDLRKDTDLARSRLLHRLGLLEIEWGRLARTGQSGRGTFREIWNLQWEPGFAVDVIAASRWGSTVEAAACARAADRAKSAPDLAALAELMDQVLLADLAAAVHPVISELEARAALTADASQLLGALPPLANVFRYGSVRRTDGDLVAHLIDGLILRASIGLPLSCSSLDEQAAEALRKRVLDADRAVGLRDAEEPAAAWQKTLRQVALQEGAQPLLRGLCARLLFDAGKLETDEARNLFSLNLSVGMEPSQAAAWFDGFLNRNAMVLLHDNAIWSIADQWLANLNEEHFQRVLPLVRRTFSAFAPAERRDLASRVRSGVAPVAVPAVAADWDEARALMPLPILKTILGVQA